MKGRETIDLSPFLIGSQQQRNFGIGLCLSRKGCQTRNRVIWGVKIIIASVLKESNESRRNRHEKSREKQEHFLRLQAYDSPLAKPGPSEKMAEEPEVADSEERVSE